MLYIDNSYSLLTVLGVAVISFGLGLFYKSAIVRKQRKRILNLEDEMLSNHARMLSLEKKIAEGTPRKEKNGVHHDFDPASSRKSDIQIQATQP